MEYDAAYQSYKENEKELKDTLTAMATTAALYYKESKDTRYALIQDAALDYIGTSNDEEAKKVAQKFVDSGIELTGNLIIDEIISKVSDYISSSAASGSAGAGVAKVAAAVKVGYDVGMAIDELLLNNTKVSNNFEYLRACACMEDLLCNILQGEEANMKSKQTYSSALLFHQTYIIYSTVQKYGIDLMIQTSNLDLEDDYGSKIFSWITHIYTDKQANEIVGMYNLCAKKADYMKMLCCDKEFGNGRKGKIAVIACPIDVTVTDAAGNIVAQVVDNKVVGKTSDDVEICCSAGVKYLYLASDKYDLKLEATDSGKMSYFVYGFNQDGIMESRSGYAELPIKKGEIYNGKVSCVEEQTAISADLEKDNKVVEGKQDLSGDSLQQCKIDVQAESGGTAIGSKSCVVGDVVAIAAYPDAGYRFAGWYINNQIVAKTEKYIFHAAENTSVKAAFVPVEEKTNPTIPDRVAVNQSITANSRTVAYGTKPFALNAQAKTNLTYTSSNTKVATVSGAGKVTIKGTGKAVITITAEATENYNAASKQVTITVTPKKASGLKVKTAKKKMTVSWKKDTRASGYQITYAQNKKFTKGKKSVTVSKNKTTKKTIKKLKSKKTYYVKVRAYKKSGSTKLYGSYSKVKKAKVK